MNPDALRALYGEPQRLARLKQLDHLDAHCRAFIALSPFLVLASAGADGSVDASPRGDAPGFVAVPDARTLLIPDRRGNNRIDSLGNIAANPEVGLIFFVPGINETLRVNGRVEIATDADLLAQFAVNGKAPKSALRVAVREAFLHCGKALIRAKLWTGEHQVPRDRFPTLGRILADQIDGQDADAADAAIAESYRDRLY